MQRSVESAERAGEFEKAGGRWRTARVRRTCRWPANEKVESEPDFHSLEDESERPLADVDVDSLLIGGESDISSKSDTAVLFRSLFLAGAF